jgi:hypothetical protein
MRGSLRYFFQAAKQASGVDEVPRGVDQRADWFWRDDRKIAHPNGEVSTLKQVIPSTLSHPRIPKWLDRWSLTDR